MTGKIFRSIFGVAVCVLLGCLVILFGVLYSYFMGVQENSLKTMLNLSASGVEQSGLGYFERLDKSCRLTWIDPQGRVLFDSEKDAYQMENHLEREEIQKAFSTGEGRSVRHSSTLREKTINHAQRLQDGTVLRASVKVAAVWTLILGMLQPLSVIFLFALMLSTLLAYRLSKNIIEPLENIDLDHPLEGSVYEELTPLLGKIDAQNKRISAQKQELEEKRVQMDFAEESRREFTANVSHELRTPLQSIMGRAELLENGLVQSDDVSRFAAGMRQEATRLLTLIEDILHLSALDENAPLPVSTVDLYQLCQQEWERMKELAKEREVTMVLLGETARIKAVPQLMQEIVHNLLENAVKYNKLQGKITVRVYQGEGKHILSVSDTGIGIAKEHQEHIFERFYRVDKSHSKSTGGTGLGLSIVKHAVAYMKGSIRLESEKGVGTTITIAFPA